MVCEAPSQPLETPSVTPHSDVAAFLVERNYRLLGCDQWGTKRVQILCAKLGATPAVMAARLRLPRQAFERRIKADSWTKQDGLILTLLEREIDFLRTGNPPASPVVAETKG